MRPPWSSRTAKQQLGGTNFTTLTNLSVPGWIGLDWHKTTNEIFTDLKKKKKKACCQLTTVLYQLNLSKRISKVFLNHFRKMRVLSWQLPNHVWYALLSGHNSHELLRMISQSGPALGTLPWSSLCTGIKPLAHSEAWAWAKEGPLGVMVHWMPWGRDWTEIIFELLMPSSVRQRKSTQ